MLRTTRRARWSAPLLVAAATLLVIEGVVAVRQVPAYILPAPHAVVAELVARFPMLVRATLVTTGEAVTGYVFGVVIGVALALTTFYLPAARRWGLPWVILINSVPSAALAPLMVLYWGAGPASKVVLVALITFFATYLNVERGLQSVDHGAVALMRAFGASEPEILRKLRVPMALPFFFNALKVSTVRSMIVTIVAEMLGAHAGLGYVVMETSIMMENTRLWAAVLLGSAVSITFFLFVSWGERRLVWWRSSLGAR